MFHGTRLLGDYGLCPIAPIVSFSLISCLAKTFLKSSPYALFHLQIAVSLVSTPRSLSLLTLFACHHCIHFVITCILLITRLLTVTLYAKIHTALSNVLCELLFVRNGCFNISIFSSSDINDLITNICCN